jgi:3-oxoacyl-[acyl-carrier protein] reductase
MIENFRGPKMRIKDKVALVTGAGGHLGRGIALRLAEEGARIMVNDIIGARAEETVDLIFQSGGSALCHSADVTKSNQVYDMVQVMLSAWGKVDILVNNAGMPRDALLVKMNEEDWDFVVDLCLKGSFLCAKAVTPHMIDRKSGKIINISSMSYKGNIGQVNYASAKAGVVGMTRCLGLELARYGINVNCVAPGLINTEITASFPEDVKKRLLQTIPMRKMGEIRDIANIVLFLASDEAGFISRQVIHVSGGAEGF